MHEKLYTMLMQLRELLDYAAKTRKNLRQRGWMALTASTAREHCRCQIYGSQMCAVAQRHNVYSKASAMDCVQTTITRP